MLMDFSVIVLTYNAKDVTLKMLKSLREALQYLDKKTSKKIKWEVLIQENGSADGVGEAIKKEFGDFVKINWDRNVGFAKGNNNSVKLTDKSSKYVLFLNPDVVLDENAIYKTYKFMEENHDVGLTTCQVDLWTGGLDIDCHRAFPTPWNAFCYFSGLEKLFGYTFPKQFGGYHLLYKNFKKTHEIDACLGAFMFVRREIGDKVGWMPEEYFLNGEDVDFCYQIKKIAKSKIMYFPETRVVHYKGASKGTKKQSENISQASDKTKVTQINSGIDAMKIFYNKYYVDKYPWVVNKLVFLGIWILKQRRIILKKE